MNQLFQSISSHISLFKSGNMKSNENQRNTESVNVKPNRQLFQNYFLQKISVKKNRNQNASLSLPEKGILDNCQITEKASSLVDNSEVLSVFHLTYNRQFRKVQLEKSEWIEIIELQISWIDRIKDWVHRINNKLQNRLAKDQLVAYQLQKHQQSQLKIIQQFQKYLNNHRLKLKSTQNQQQIYSPYENAFFKCVSIFQVFLKYISLFCNLIQLKMFRVKSKKIYEIVQVQNCSYDNQSIQFQATLYQKKDNEWILVFFIKKIICKAVQQQTQINKEIEKPTIENKAIKTKKQQKKESQKIARSIIIELLQQIQIVQVYQVVDEEQIQEEQQNSSEISVQGDCKTTEEVSSPHYSISNSETIDEIKTIKISSNKSSNKKLKRKRKLNNSSKSPCLSDSDKSSQKNSVKTYISNEVFQKSLLSPIQLSKESSQLQVVDDLMIQQAQISRQQILSHLCFALHIQESLMVSYLDVQKKNEMIAESRREVIRKLIKVAKEIPHVNVTLFGSCKTEISLPNSDIDLMITKKDICSREDLSPLLYDLFNRLQNKLWIINIKPLFSANIPLIKIDVDLSKYSSRFKNTKIISVDISFMFLDNEWPRSNIHLGIETSELITKYLNYWPSLRVLSIMFKLIIKSCNLNNLSEGGISSYCLIIMIIAYLQSDPLLPQDLPMQFFRILEFYAIKFNEEKLGINLTFYPSAFYCLDQFQSAKLQVNEPISNNLISANVTKFKQIQSELASCYEMLLCNQQAICIQISKMNEQELTDLEERCRQFSQINAVLRLNNIFDKYLKQYS